MWAKFRDIENLKSPEGRGSRSFHGEVARQELCSELPAGCLDTYRSGPGSRSGVLLFYNRGAVEA